MPASMLRFVCGIAGVAGKGPPDREALALMAHAMIHRGPDGEGLWADDVVGLAFRRLSIIDLHERSNQPMHLGALHLVFNGEIYNYIELRDELRRRGHRFSTAGDGEVLLHAWAEWGVSSLERLNGMFAFAIWDRARKELTLVTDRFAEKPLFFHEGPSRIVFASDVRSLRAFDSKLARPDSEALSDFIALGIMPELPRTFFTDVMRLPPSHLVRWDGTNLTLQRWWEPQVVDVPTNPTVAADALRDLIRDSVRLRLRSDVPLGTSLSGGVDSSGVVAMCSQIAGGAQRHAFTAAFRDFRQDEWDYAAEVATIANVVEHRAVRPDVDDLLDDLGGLVADQEEPFGTTSIFAQRCVMREAHSAGIKVMLDGQGADELFAGYLNSRGWALRSMGISSAATAIAHDLNLLEPVAVAYSVPVAPQWLAVRYRLRRASPYARREAVHEAARFQPSPSSWPLSGSPLRRELLIQTFQTSLPNLCRFCDRNSMAFGVEVRFPYLDYRIAEFALSTPASLLYRGGMTKRVLRDALSGLVPANVLNRRDKVAFETPEAQWFAAPAAKERIAEVLSDRETPHTVDRRQIESDLRQGRWRDASAIWRAVNAALWARQWAPGTGAT